MQIGEYLKNYKIEDLEKSVKPKGRRVLIKELFDLYNTEVEKNSRKKENWKRYIAYLKAYRVANGKSKEKYVEWLAISKKRKIPANLCFLEPLTDKVFAIKVNMAVPKGDEHTLHWLVSNAKDMHNRGNAFAPWMFAAMKEGYAPKS